ncbi:hypothetical protein K239x_42400 [Planctomycetes bacterium K23_9]|uniref:Uncharacterized protein n=1 Tax=Stieleria marina TaxID=1930275 RepID=A0A517NYN2_9BACT|nr:hypothetical protein K239x_42400 [Planctomycetes bacterium K23_9]
MLVTVNLFANSSGFANNHRLAEKFLQNQAESPKTISFFAEPFLCGTIAQWSGTRHQNEITSYRAANSGGPSSLATGHSSPGRHDLERVC